MTHVDQKTDAHRRTGATPF